MVKSLENRKAFIQYLADIPLYIFLFPLFFVFHNYVEHYSFIPVVDVIFLYAKYLSVALVLVFIFFLFYRNMARAALMAAITLSFEFFFGAIHDSIKESGIEFIARYSVLLSLMLFLFLFLLVWIRKVKITARFTRFLWILFLVLLALDVFKLVGGFNEKEGSHVQLVKPCSACEKPDVYLVVLDGYAGAEQLREQFSFSNTEFYEGLDSLGLTVGKSTLSNYSSTAFSTASMLNMKFLEMPDMEFSERNLNYSYKEIYSSSVVEAFKDLGYSFINNSIFDIDGQKANINKTFLVSGTQLITSQTLVNRFKKDVYYNLLMNHFPNSFLHKEFVFSDHKNNESIISRLTIQLPEKAKPAFMYSHLMMPHFPYYYNENGKLNSLKDLHGSNFRDEKLYLGYLKYTNKKVLEILSTIISNHKKPPLIILLSDHGFRYSIKDNSFANKNLLAVYFPGVDFKLDSMSNVNLFPQILNKMFQQELPIHENKILQ